MFVPDSQGKLMFIWRSYSDLVRGVKDWSSRLPEFSAVAGLPRSGLLVANLLALHRNIPLLSGKPYTSREKVLDTGAPILFVDDTAWTGASARLYTRNCKYENVEFGCYLCRHACLPLFDHVYIDSGEANQLLEWNMLHTPFNELTLSDLDGVISEDWDGTEEDDHLEKYLYHISHARCLIRPTHKLLGIVTSRLEKYRPQTETWLKARCVEYETLYMNPAESAKERLENDGFAGWKSRVYQSLPKAHMFVESSHDQAVAIHFRTEKPVLDWEGKHLLQANPMHLTPVVGGLPQGLQ